jgi:hypothetical protein
MAVGDDANAAGYPLVPNTGSEDAKVRYGAREINRTRDFVAQVKLLVLAVWPVERGGTGATDAAGARLNLGFTYGTAAANNADGQTDGAVYFKIVT